jgi:solute carrier family 35 protein E1
MGFGPLRYLPGLRSPTSDGALLLPGFVPTLRRFFASGTATLALLIIVWYTSSLLTSLTTKEILRIFPYPITLAATQQTLAALCGWANLRTTRRTRSLLSDTNLHLSTLPVAAVMMVTLASYRIALMSASVSFAHTVKTLGPVFTIAFSRLLLGERLPLARYVFVIPVILGVSLTSITEAEFAMAGFLAVLLSTAACALSSVLAKRLMREQDLGKAELFAMAALQALLMLLPLSVALDARRICNLPLNHSHLRRVGLWLLLNGFCSYVNQYSGLSVLDAMSSPLSHALANVMKRFTVITIATLYQARPVTALHLLGMALSVFGALGYQHDACACFARAPGAVAYELLPLHEEAKTRGVLLIMHLIP